MREGEESATLKVSFITTPPKNEKLKKKAQSRSLSSLSSSPTRPCSSPSSLEALKWVKRAKDMKGLKEQEAAWGQGDPGLSSLMNADKTITFVVFIVSKALACLRRALPLIADTPEVMQVRIRSSVNDAEKKDVSKDTHQGSAAWAAGGDG